MMKQGDRSIRASGGCLCRSVRYVVRGALADVKACHCLICRRLHGYCCAYTACNAADLEILPSTRLRWHRASPMARRGFCSKCGAQLFSIGTGRTHVSIMASSVDEPTGLRLVKHVCVSQKGDYYELADGLPQEGGRDPESRC